MSLAPRSAPRPVLLARQPGWRLASAAAVLVLAAAWIAATQGAYVVTLADFFSGAEASAGAQVFWHIRAPRLLMGLVAGAALGVSGALIQGLFRNPLADPGLIGVSGGAALGAALAIVLCGPVTAWLAAGLGQLTGADVASLPAWPGHGHGLGPGPWLIMGSAFLGGLMATLLVWRLARTGGQVHVPLLLLVGVAINALAGAGLGLMSHLASDDQLRTITFWLLGSLSGAQWQTTLACGAVVLAVLVMAPSQARALNALALGEAQARLMGVNVPLVQRLCVLWVALAVGAVTALIGMVSFVGLLAPHAMRLLAGPDHRVVLPGSAVLGAVLVVLADTLARTIFSPGELPLGVLTGLLGAPMFLLMLRRRFTSIH
ncbi:MAG: iron ABC transporter permease [Rubrivivax sp.]|nr:MAG: iron ABC transporter permease [Rubrivivax sp.]